MPPREQKVSGRIAALLMAASICGHTQQGIAAASATGPASIDVGPVAITPTLGADFKHRSNIYLQEDDETSSWIFLLRPEVRARAQDRDNYYEVSYEGETAWYDEDMRDNRNNYFDHTFRANADILYDEYWSFNANARYAFLHEDRGTGITEGNIGQAVDEPVEYEEAYIGGGVEYGTQRDIGRITVEAGYMDRVYQNFRELTRSRDREEVDLSPTFFYPIAPKTDIFARYRFKDVSYPNPFETLPALDSKEHSLTGGVEWEITPNTTSSAEVGYLRKNFDDSGRDDYTGLTWEVDLRMQLREQDLVVVTGSRGSQETNLQGDFIRNQRLQVEWTHDWSDRVYTSLSGSVANDKYEGSFNGREDDIYNLTLRANYEFRRWARFFTSYAWDEKDSNIDDLSYTDYTFQIGVDLSL